MSTILSKEALRYKLIDLLREDGRTEGHLSEVSDAIFILERPDFLGGPNWELARWEPFRSLAPDLNAALMEAEAVAQADYRLATLPLGGSTV
ncbi:hypothetical protein [Paracidovorax valerianellae]|uniref:Uncharacterized protein n=1 Tax=Paracidovorax valerianellae TaxID=187868 RepID=A0A1G7EL45_9BURK|nr:hypothetical protein [Paracidovorax valerianellae]MDA8446392.1 hypothetical protein [Paracidovorax valerianellae]SDE64307.1 hypothetical protein SAMN05192589_12359 [Paracidovorax valerianellae]